MLCYTCHVKEKERLSLVHTHTPIAEGRCNGCHEPHVSRQNSLLKTTADKICLDCHSGFLEGQKEGYLHPLSQKGACLTCHDPHASIYYRALRMSSDLVCLANGCHDSIIKHMKKSRIVHKPLNDGKCIACHNAHGSKLAHYLKCSAGSLCLFCHEEMKGRIEEEGVTVHSPIQQGECLRCHSGHDSAYQGLLLAQGKDLCIPCHETGDTGFQEKHIYIQAQKSNCLMCHASHTSEKEGLFLPFIHQPFIQKNCQVCHE